MPSFSSAQDFHLDKNTCSFFSFKHLLSPLVLLTFILTISLSCSALPFSHPRNQPPSPLAKFTSPELAARGSALSEESPSMRITDLRTQESRILLDGTAAVGTCGSAVARTSRRSSTVGVLPCHAYQQKPRLACGNMTNVDLWGFLIRTGWRLQALES